MPNSEEDVLEILANIADISSPYKRGLKLADIAPKLTTPNSLLQALEIVSKIREPEPCALALSKLSPYLNDSQILEALRLASSINTSSSNRTNAITILSSRVTPDLILEALEIARKIVSTREYRACTDFLAAIIPQVSPKLLQEVLAIAYKIDDEESRKNCIDAVVELNEDLEQFYNSSNTDLNKAKSSDHIDNSASRYRAERNEKIDRDFCSVPRTRAKILGLLFYYLGGEQRSQVFEKLIETIEEIPAQPCKARSLMALAPYLPKNLAKRAAERAFIIVKEIIKNIARETQDSSIHSFDGQIYLLKIQKLEIQLHTLPISTLLGEILSILEAAESFLFSDIIWWKPNMIEGLPPEPIPTPRQTIEHEPEFVINETNIDFGNAVIGFVGLLGDEVEMAQPETAPNTVAQPINPPPEKRYLNAGIKEHEHDKPLVVGETYLLEFKVDIEKGIFSSARLPDNKMLFNEEETMIDLTIQLDGDDFDIAPSTRTLTLLRYGASKKVSFAITPKQERRSTLTATVHKEGNFVIEMELTFPVGVKDTEVATSSVHGRLLSDAQYLKPRTLGMGFKQVEAGYECIVWGTVSERVVLPLNSVELNVLIDGARKAMMDVVMYKDANNTNIFQSLIDIDADSSAAALKTLAFAGAELFQGLFFGPAAGTDVMEIGDSLKELAMRDTPIKLQIVAENFPVPWGLLYFGETRNGATLDWNNFLGMRHIIEQIPRQRKMRVYDYEIKSNNPSLSVSLNLNISIDEQMKFNGVARQVQDWLQRSASSKGAIELTQRQTKTDLLTALSSLSNDQLMYFYCHANTYNPSESRDPGSSFITLTNHERITLADLKREAPMRDTLPGNPLIFLNACESAEISPEFYDGFVPYFMAKGARGVVGTECKMPALFATEWAMLFFPRFLGGAPLSELFLELRQEFCKQHNNPLGLLYTVYCNGDTYINPSLI
jgi:CHAT domain